MRREGRTDIRTDPGRYRRRRLYAGELHKEEIDGEHHREDARQARVIETTRMDLHSGIMLEDDFLDISDYLNQGVLLERSVFITTSDDMQLLKRAVTIIEPDELDAIDGVYADGKPILVRTEDGSRLAPSVFEVLFDDSGNYLGDHGQGSASTMSPAATRRSCRPCSRSETACSWPTT